MFIFLLALASLTDGTKQVVPVDICEINHVHSVCPKEEYRFTQIILWRWQPFTKEFRVAQWSMAKPSTIFVTGKEVVWYRQGKRYHVKAAVVKETSTRGDPEVHDHQFLDPERRTPYWK